MGYGRLQVEPSEPGGSSVQSQPATSRSGRSNKKLVFFSVLSIVLIAVSAVSAVFLIGVRTRAGSSGSSDPSTIRHRPSQAISRACGRTRFPSLCVNSLVEFPGALGASEEDLVHISFNMTLQRLNRALYDTAGISFAAMDALSRSAYDACLELLEDSVDALSSALSSVVVGGAADGARPLGVGASQDVLTWLSAALTNQDTCSEGFDGVSHGTVKSQVAASLKDLSELVSNCLALFSGTVTGDFAGVPIQNRRRLMESDDESENVWGGFPVWMEKKERKLLTAPASAIQADIVVSKDGNGSNGRYATVAQAIKKAPEHGTRRFIIYVMAGRYEEDNLKVGRKKTNIMFIGDGIGKTVISGGKSIFNNITTFHTASFAATGAGFIARDITFVNWAGPWKHQAVALRIGADHAVVYRCQVIGYQDSLYVHSNRQFFRECEIYGTVDFIFGNAAVVFQNCSIFARKPMPMQKNTVTAQNRKDPNQNTGISIHNCRLLASSDLEASKGTFATYLGRPWKLYSRTVYLMSYMGDHVHPRGWLEWNATFALDTLYYGEYMNSGPGGAVGQRVKWPGYRVITSTVEASKFTVAQFIYGSSWLPSTGVAFLAGLSV